MTAARKKLRFILKLYTIKKYLRFHQLVLLYSQLAIEHDVTQIRFLDEVKLNLNSEFSFSLTGCLDKAEREEMDPYLSQEH